MHALLRKAELIDAQEDGQYGKGKRGNELPEELHRRSSRLEWIRKAKAELEAEAAAGLGRSHEKTNDLFGQLLIAGDSGVDAKVCARCLWRSDTSNTPLEWAGHHKLSAAPPQAPCLPLRGSVRRTDEGGRCPHGDAPNRRVFDAQGISPTKAGQIHEGVALLLLIAAAGGDGAEKSIAGASGGR